MWRRLGKWLLRQVIEELLNERLERRARSVSSAGLDPRIAPALARREEELLRRTDVTHRTD